MHSVHITKKAIDLGDFKKALRDPSVGGHAIFVGTVRDHQRGLGVVRLEYEAYVPMAEKVLAEIAGETEEKFGVKACRIVHRIGLLEPGEIALVVAVSSGHRREAFSACEYVVDELKRRVPIWKKEVYQNGTSEWIGGAEYVELG